MAGKRLITVLTIRRKLQHAGPCGGRPAAYIAAMDSANDAAAVRTADEADDVLHSMLFDGDEPAPSAEVLKARHCMVIRAADTEGHRSAAHVLVERRYADSGYTTAPSAGAQTPARFTLTAEVNDTVQGTLTIGFDGSGGLLVDQCFGDATARLRDEGATLCEFIKFAVDSVAHSKRVLAALFHTAFIYAYVIRGCDRIVIEVNPRHVRFYAHMLGFEVLADERINPRVNAPAVLMSIDLHYGAERIAMAHREPGRRSERSMYRYFFSAEETRGIVRRLLAKDEPAPALAH